MKILAIDTSAVTASAAILEDGALITATELRSKMTHSQKILPMVEDMLKNAALCLKDIDVAAVNVGPGSFTGVRIGVAAVKGLCFADAIPCVAVSTLESMAYNFIGLPQKQTVCAVMDARCGQVYTAMFEVGESVARLTPDQAISIEKLGKSLKNLEKAVILVGDGAKLCYTTLGNVVPNLHIAPDHLRYQNAVGVAAAAYRSDKRCDAAALQPVYLRLPQAERELKAKQAEQKK